jgi:MIP family channel proteins
MNNKALLAEFIGTAALIFVGAGAAAIGVGGLVGVAFAHGLVVTAMVYSYGPISGAHINPAVTFAITLSGQMEWSEALRYWVVQLLGGALGAAGLFYLLGSESSLGATVPAAGVSIPQAILLEALLTFLLVNSILHTAVKGEGTPFAGLAIGLTLAALILMGGPLTGASLNPARTFGPALFSGTLDLFWVYVLGTGLGAALAALVYRALK